MVVRMNALREQVSFLSEQLKIVMKRSMILESEIAGLSPDLLKKSKASNASASSSTKSLPRDVKRGLKSSESEPILKQMPSGKSPLSYSADKLLAIERSQSRTALKLNTMAHTLNHQVVRDLKAIKQSKKSIDLELEDSIKTTLKEIVSRRADAVVRGLKSRKSLSAGMQAIAFTNEITKQSTHLTPLLSIGIDICTLQRAVEAPSSRHYLLNAKTSV